MREFFPYKSRISYRSGGVNQDHTWLVKCEAIGKARNEDSHYLMANEWIAGNIAQFLRLPIPPFNFLSKRSVNKTAMFCSYNFAGDSKPSDVDPQVLYSKYPDKCVGIVLFDILVLNCDRHGGNLKVDKPEDPKRFYIFDHERALFYIQKKRGTERLESRKNRLGISDGNASSDTWHCLIEFIDSPGLIGEWCGKIRQIPDWFIDDICKDVQGLGILKAETEAVSKFLKDRRDALGELILDNRDRFPLVSNWPLFL